MESKMNEAYNVQTLVERLGKLNNSQQSIEGLSAWCIPNRKKAKQIVETWDQVFISSSQEQRVPLLYLANDILQNSRRKGSEFVNEFWKVLPGCLKSVYEKGEEQGKKVVNRLVDIWDERKVFGSRGQGLKDEILGNAPPALDNGQNSNPIKVVRKDASSLRIKLAVGGMPEKIVSAYQTVLDEHFNEDTALSKCKAATELVDSMKKDIEDTYAQGNQPGSSLINDLVEHEAVLRQCVEQLGNSKTSRTSLIVLLKEAIKEQESKQELVDRQLEVAQVEIEYAGLMKQKLESAATINGVGLNSMSSNAKLGLEMTVTEQNATQLPQGQPLTSFASMITSTEEEHKKAAAAVAAKLTASSSSAEVFSSILSSFVAEEAASKNSGLSGGVRSHGSPIFPVEKRPKLEKPMGLPDMGGNTLYYGQMQQQQSTTHIVSQSPTTSVQPLSQNNQGSTSFTPPPPPLPPLPPPPGQQYAQTSGVTMGMVPFGFMGNALPLPLPSHISPSLTRPGNIPSPPLPPLPQQQQLLPQQLQTSMGIYPSPGLAFFGQLQTSPSAQQQ